MRLGELAHGWGAWEIAGEALRKARDSGEQEAEAWLSSLPEPASGRQEGGVETGDSAG
jgi:hypothetical protein